MHDPADVANVLSLVRKGLKDREVAELTGIPRTTVRDWRRGVVPRVSDRRRANAHCICRAAGAPRATMEYAYALGLYLGDGCISKGPRTYALRFALDAAYPGIVAECVEALNVLMPGQSAWSKQRPAENCVDVVMYSCHWPCLFPQHGRGRKHERPIILEPWQTSLVEANRRSFLRGLVHSDGCRYIANDRGRPSPRYHFSNRSLDIQQLFRESLDALGVKWTTPTWYETAVYRIASVELLDDFIGPKT